MRIISKTLDIKPAYVFSEQSVFFDIETTGLSAINSVLYLIGAVYYENDAWQFIQWFADECADESKLIDEFFKLINNKKYLIHYNGNGFDIPYIKKKLEQYDMDYTFDCVESIDLYNIAKKYKKLLKLDNCKLVTVEKYLGIIREDKYSGKELIDTYKEYIKVYSLERLKGDLQKSELLLKDLLLHNEEDIINLLEVTKIKYLDEVFDGNIIYDSCEVDDDKVLIKYHTFYRVPIENSLILKGEKNDITIRINALNNYKSNIEIEIPIYNCTLKYFYKDYKNYYYLTNEDTAIHKSVAQYVDKEYRVQAKPSTCYIKKHDRFVIGIKNIKVDNEDNIPEFKKDYKDKESYYQLSKINDIGKYGIKLITECGTRKL